MLRFPRVATALAIGLLFTSACGGSSKPAAKSSDNTPTGQNSSSSQSTDSSSNGGGGGGGTIAGGGVVIGNYSQGSAHVEISGGRSESTDFNAAGGATTPDGTFVSFTSGDGQNSMTITVSPKQDETGVAVSINGLTTGGAFNDKCRIDVTKNDASELTGTFTCTGVDGVSGSQVFQGNLNVTGRFSAKR